MAGSSGTKEPIEMFVTVRVVVEVACPGYGGEWKFDDLERQVTRESIEAVTNAIAKGSAPSLMRVTKAEGVSVQMNRKKG